MLNFFRQLFMGYPFIKTIDPLTVLGIGSAVAGGLGSIFGTGSKQEIPPELREIYNLLLQRSKEGLSTETENLILRQLKTQIGEEAGALGALTESRLTRGGAGMGVKQTALDRINTQRLRSVGEGVTKVGIMDEESKQNALRMLSYIVPEFSKYRESYGEGFADLLQGGLSYLLNKPGKNKSPISTGDYGFG